MIHDLENYTHKSGEMINDIRNETRSYIVTNKELNNVKETALKKRFVRTVSILFHKLTKNRMKKRRLSTDSNDT